MKSQSSQTIKIRYSKSDRKKQVIIEGEYSETHSWTLILDNMSSLHELGDLITAVRADVLGIPIYEPSERNQGVQS